MRISTHRVSRPRTFIGGFTRVMGRILTVWDSSQAFWDVGWDLTRKIFLQRC